MNTLSRKFMLLILVAVIAVILFVLISPLPKMHATGLHRLVTVILITIVLAHFSAALFLAAPHIGVSTAKDFADLLASSTLDTVSVPSTPAFSKIHSDGITSQPTLGASRLEWGRFSNNTERRIPEGDLQMRPNMHHEDDRSQASTHK